MSRKDTATSIEYVASLSRSDLLSQSSWGDFMKPIFLVAAGLVMFAFGQPAAAQSISVDQIVQLSQLKLGDEAIIAKIKAEGATFTLSTDQMIDLRQKGVSSAVIAAMLEKKTVATAEMSLDSADPNVPHPPGLYLLAGSGDSAKMVRIDPLSANQMKTGGIIGYALTGGIASASIKVAIPNESAKAKAPTTPRFFFFFDESRGTQSTASFLGSTFGASSPAEFSLVRLTEKKDRREARVGSMNIGGAKTGVMDKDRIGFDYELVRPGVYRVKSQKVLEPGEYGFLYAIAGAGSGGAAAARIFDFSVR